MNPMTLRANPGRHLLAAASLLLGACAGAPTVAEGNALVRVDTELGEFQLEIELQAAPITAGNFLRYVEGGHYDGGRFHRSVRLDNQRRSDVLIEVIQGGTTRGSSQQGFPPIELERTRDTGLLHVDGAISMARAAPDSGRSDFFVCINDQPSLDFGGARNDDGQGFAVFGRVISGMDVIHAIHAAPTERENLAPPIRIVSATRLH